MIRAYTEERLAAFNSYAAEHGGASQEQFVAAGRACLRSVEHWDSNGYAEHCGIAEGAGIEAGLLYAVTNMTDVRDILLLPASADREGCTAVLVPRAGSRTAEILVAQTWDLNPGDLDYVIALLRLPSTGPKTWAITCAGALSLVGMNEHGLCVGTTNLKTRRSRVGVGYISILHRALSANALVEARAIVRAAPRAAAHTYWVADAASAEEFEADPEGANVRELSGGPIVRTNHCLSPALRAYEGELPSVSSQQRHARATRWLAASQQDVATLQALFADRSDGVNSVNRYPEDDQGTATNACFIANPARRRLWACRGPADRGAWIEFSF